MASLKCIPYYVVRTHNKPRGYIEVEAEENAATSWPSLSKTPEDDSSACIKVLPAGQQLMTFEVPELEILSRFPAQAPRKS